MKQESKKYHETKPGSIQDTVMQMQVNEQKSVTVRVKELSAMIETYLNKGGVSHSLSPAIAEKEISGVLPLQAVREFIGTYNRHFSTNYAAEEFVVENQTQEGGPGSGPQKGGGKYKSDGSPMAGEFGFVSKKAMDDNAKTVGGNKGVQAMMKKGMSAADISNKYGMHPAAVKKMAKGQTL